MVTRKLLLALATALLGSLLRAEMYVSTNFTGTSAPGWTFVTTAASLTANTGTDPAGQGWLRLTADKTWQQSFVYCNTALPTAAGLVFTFDFVVWGAATSLADGLALAVFDAAVTPGAGGYGGSLGYAQRTGINGLAGGIVGFGFDTFGNFSNPTEGRIGGPGLVKNAISIRGSMGATRLDGYQYVTGTSSLGAFSTGNADSRDDAVVHTVRITIPTDKKISIEWKIPDGEWVKLIDKYQCSLTCPGAVKFGFTAGTGGLSSNQEIRNLSVTSVPEPAGLALALIAAGVLMIPPRRPGKGSHNTF